MNPLIEELTKNNYVLTSQRSALVTLCVFTQKLLKVLVNVSSYLKVLLSNAAVWNQRNLYST